MRNLQARDRPGAALVQNLRIVVLDQVVRDVLHARAFNLVFFAVPQQDGGKILVVDIRCTGIACIVNRSQFFIGCRYYVTFCSINRIQIPRVCHHACRKETVSALYGVINTRIQPCTVVIMVLTTCTVCSPFVSSRLSAWCTFRKLQQCRYLLFFKAFVHKVVAVGHDVFSSTVHRDGGVIGTNRIFIQGKTIRDCGGCTRCTAIATVAADTCKQVGII